LRDEESLRVHLNLRAEVEGMRGIVSTFERTMTQRQQLSEDAIEQQHRLFKEMSRKREREYQERSREREQEFKEQMSALKERNYILRKQACGRFDPKEVDEIRKEWNSTSGEDLDESRYDERPDPLADAIEEAIQEETGAVALSRKDKCQSIFYATEQKTGQSFRNYMCELTRLCIDGWGKRGDPELIKGQFIRGLADDRVARILTEEITEGVFRDMTNEEVINTATAIKQNLEEQVGAKQTKLEVQAQGKKDLEDLARKQEKAKQGREEDRKTFWGAKPKEESPGVEVRMRTFWGAHSLEPDDSSPEMEANPSTYGRYPSDERWLKECPSLCRGCAQTGHYVSNCEDPYLMESVLHVARMKRIFKLTTISEVWQQGNALQEKPLRVGEQKVWCYRCGGAGHYASKCWTVHPNKLAGEFARERTERERAANAGRAPRLTDAQRGTKKVATTEDTGDAAGTLVTAAASLNSVARKTVTRRVLPRAKPEESAVVVEKELVPQFKRDRSRSTSPSGRTPEQEAQRRKVIEKATRRFWPHRPRTVEEQEQYRLDLSMRLHPGGETGDEAESMPELVSADEGARDSEN
jgi:hypothetical protein